MIMSMIMSTIATNKALRVKVNPMAVTAVALATVSMRKRRKDNTRRARPRRP